MKFKVGLQLLESNIIKKLLFIILLGLFSSFAAADDYRNFYGINWRGAACDNIDYAKSMGYDYVMYQTGMEKCANINNLKFYLESPDRKGFPGEVWKIDYNKAYTTEQKTAYSDFFLWKSSDSFPDNIATGWFYDSNNFKPLPDLQRQEIIDKIIAANLAFIKSKEVTSKNFRFGGYSWDVPLLDGDLWNKPQSSGGKQVGIKYWTGTDSGVKHPGETYKYSSYKAAVIGFKIQLNAATKKVYPDMKILIEPYLPYEDYIQDIESLSDKLLLKPDYICQEGLDYNNPEQGLEFVKDTNLFDSGLMTKSQMCSSAPKAYSHTDNLRIAGNAAINKAWFSWFGRFGGSGDTPDYSSIKVVPARMKLIRAMVGWDNIKGASSRTWSESNMQYKSSNSYADKYVIYSRNPKNSNVYAVILNKDSGKIKLKENEVVDGIYRTDSLFRKGELANEDFSTTDSGAYLTLALKDSAYLNKGYIIETTQG